MQTEYTIIQPDGTEEVRTADLPEQPHYRELADLILPALGKGRDLERINVFWNGAYTDMFVDDSGALGDLPQNAKATAIYTNNLKVHDPVLAAAMGDQPVHGTAILFSRRVWF